MEAKLNIANILKDKPSDTKLYADAFGELKFVKVDEVDTIYTKNKTSTLYCFYNNGKYDKYGEHILVPSKEMRDWNKFAWKKGDVLVSNDYGKEVIFYDWYDDTYTNFYGKHLLYSEDKNSIKYNDAFICMTGRYSLEDKDAAQTYIKDIEKRLGGKLNHETLEIEKQTEFKDGDIVVTDAVPSMCYSKCIFILKGGLNTGESRANSYVFFNINNNHISYDVLDTIEINRNIHLATDSEKQQLFDALAKENKAWYAKKKQIVDLKPKWWTPKPFDRVITRNAYDDIWTANIFSHMNSCGEYVTIGCASGYHYCLPYNDETAHLLGTTDEWKGGEG